MNKHYRGILVASITILLSVQAIYSIVPWPENISSRNTQIKSALNYINRAKPPSPVRNIAEYEPMEATLIRYPLRIPVELVKDLAEDIPLYCYTGASQQSQATQTFTNAGVKMSNVIYIDLKSVDFWPRDHGPWYIAYGQEKIGIVDFIYEENWNAPEVDDMPNIIGKLLDVPRFKMNITTAGGNFMTDGWGNAFSSDKVKRINKSLNDAQIYAQFKDYCGIEKYHMLKDPNSGDSNLDHVDCWAKYLTPDKVIIRKVPSNHQDYNNLEKVVDYFKNLTSAYGTSFKIHRVTSVGSNEAYTNSLIINNKVFVPFSNSSNDAPALEVYKKAMPGYIVKGYKYNGWKNLDALHCRVKDLADRGMLYIKHIPLHDTIVGSGNGVSLEMTIIAYSKKSLISDSCVVYYKQKDENDFKSVKLSSQSGNSYKAVIPDFSKNGEVQYYIHVADESGRRENQPYIGAPDPHAFYYVKSESIVLTTQEISKKQQKFFHCWDPFASQTTITWNIPVVEKNAKLCIYSTRGRLVREWSIRVFSGKIVWDGTTQTGGNVSAGMYLYSLQNGSNINTKKMRFIR